MSIVNLKIYIWRKKGDDTSVSAYFNAAFVIVLPGEMVGAKHSRWIAAL